MPFIICMCVCVCVYVCVCVCVYVCVCVCSKQKIRKNLFHKLNLRCPVSFLLRHFTLKHIVKHPARKNAVLDFILTNMSEDTMSCDSPKVIAPIGLSDHNSVLCYKKNVNGCTKIKIRPSITRCQGCIWKMANAL